MNLHHHWIVFILVSSVVCPVFAREHKGVDPDSLPLSTELSMKALPDRSVLPNQMEENQPLFVNEIDLKIQGLTGDVVHLSPRQANMKCTESTQFKVWDKIKTGAKSEVILKSSLGVEYRLGADALVQLISNSAGVCQIRLLQGRIRVVNTRVDAVEVESLNCVSTISQGITDIIISAMNTLIAPREGSKARVVTKKADRSVVVGDYGLVMADGTLVFTRAKRGEKS